MGCAYLNKAEHALSTAIEAGTCMPVSMGGVERLRKLLRHRAQG